MRLISSKYSDAGLNFGLLLIRVIAGSTMAVNHGLKKINNFDAIIQKGFIDPFGIGMKASLGLTIFAEVFCAILLVAGLLTRLATIPLIIAMSVAFFIAHHGQLFGDGESPALFLFIFIALFFTGPGKYSIDKMIGK
ncbi:MAG: DoxX family protein [Niabella sp.]